MIEREDVDGSWVGGEHEAIAWPVTPGKPRDGWRGTCVCGWESTETHYHRSRASADAEEHVATVAGTAKA